MIRNGVFTILVIGPNSNVNQRKQEGMVDK
jgi:hypothetical protein